MKHFRTFIPILVITLVTSAEALAQSTFPDDTPNKNEVIIDTADLRKIHAEIAIDREKHLVINPTLTDYFFSGKVLLDYFNASDRNSEFRIISDTLVYALYNWGKPSHSVITIWKIKGKKCQLLTILDRTLSSFYGSSMVEKIYKINDNTYILSGNTTGGDECLTGAHWLGIWELPRAFRIIWYNEWSDCQYVLNDLDEYPEFEYQVSYDSYTKRILVDKYVEIRYDFNGGNYKVKSRNKEIFHLEINELIKKDLTDELNLKM